MPKSPIHLIFIIFSVVMICITLTGSILFMFTNFMEQDIPKSNRSILAVLFLGYAVFRSFRLKKLYKNTVS